MTHDITCSLVWRRDRPTGMLGSPSGGDRRMRWCVWAGCVMTCLTISSCSGAATDRQLGSANAGVRTDTRQVVFLSPAVEAGWAGWCVGLVGTELSGSCGNVRSHGPILAERWGRSVGGGVRDVAVTSSDVVAVSLSNGAVIPTREESMLPDRLRVVVVEITNEDSASLGSIISRGFTALNAKREQIIESGNGVGSLGYEVRGVGWRAPELPPHSICAISSTGVNGIRAVRGGVVSENRSYLGLIGEAFVTCAHTEYSLYGGKASLLAGILTDAPHPGAAPKPLPQMRIVNKSRGIYEASAEKGEIFMRRIAGGWLFVASGPFTRVNVGFRQRLTLLEHLRATVQV
jgi:hypothetical protein